MLPDPLHPAVVHLPIALAVLVPLAAIAVAFAIRREWLPARAWGLVVLLQVLLVGSGWLALETGEHEEDRVEKVVAEARIDEHAERAETFMWIAALGLAICAAGLAPGRGGRFARAAAIAATLGVLAAGVRVGHSGGELVYQHGAASAYLSAGTAAAGETAAPSGDDD